MPETQALNLNAHYTTNPKVQRPLRNIATTPNTLPGTTHVFNDIDANRRMKAISQDIYAGTQREKRKDDMVFWKVFLGIVLAILGFKGIQKLISIFK